MKDLLPALRGPGITYHDNEPLPKLTADDEAALQNTQYRAVLSPTIAKALKDDTAI